MHLSIITPEKVLFSADAEMVVVPGTLGDFGVLDGHAPFISTIRPGVISIDATDGSKRKVAITGGITEVVPERCTVLAEIAIDCSTITAADAQGKMDQARTALESAKDDAGRAEAEKQMAFAEALKLAVSEAA